MPCVQGLLLPIASYPVPAILPGSQFDICDVKRYIRIAALHITATTDLINSIQVPTKRNPSPTLHQDITMLFTSVALFFLLASASALDGVDLDLAAEFAILAKTGVSTTVGSTVTGGMAVSPIALTAVTGFGLALDSTTAFATSGMVTGKVLGATHASPTPAYLTTAVSNMETAYHVAAGIATPDHVELYNGDIGNKTLAPGLYKWSTDVEFANDVTFVGGETGIWILQIAGNVIVGSAARVVLGGGAKAEYIFWQVAKSVDVGTTAHLEGIFLVLQMMDFKAGSSLYGAALAQTAVTLDDTDIVGI